MFEVDSIPEMPEPDAIRIGRLEGSATCSTLTDSVRPHVSNGHGGSLVVAPDVDPSTNNQNTKTRSSLVMGEPRNGR